MTILTAEQRRRLYRWKYRALNRIGLTLDRWRQAIDAAQQATIYDANRAAIDCIADDCRQRDEARSQGDIAAARRKIQSARRRLQTTSIH